MFFWSAGQPGAAAFSLLSNLILFFYDVIPAGSTSKGLRNRQKAWKSPQHMVSHERFMKMSASYELEQKNLEITIGECEQALREADKAKVDLRMLLKGLREFTELKKLTPEIVNTLIQRIEVHKSDRSTGKIRVQVDIYFTAIGLFTIPDEKELQKLMDDIRENPQKYKLSA